MPGPRTAQVEDDDGALDAAMERYADGDQAAFAELYDRLVPRLLSFLRMVDESYAEDIAQQTLLQIHVARGSFLRGSRVKPWAYAIARHLLIDRLRRAKHEVRARAEPPRLWVAEAADDPDGTLAARETAQAIERELARMPPSQREALALVRGGGMSAQQAAGVLGTTAAAVKLRASRGLRALRRVIERQARHP